MKTILLLHDEARQPTQLLRNTLPTKLPGKTEAIAACNCDRWGHPYSGCVEHRSTRASNLKDHEEMG